MRGLSGPRLGGCPIGRAVRKDVDKNTVISGISTVRRVFIGLCVGDVYDRVEGDPLPLPHLPDTWQGPLPSENSIKRGGD